MSKVREVSLVGAKALYGEKDFIYLSVYLSIYTVKIQQRRPSVI